MEEFVYKSWLKNLYSNDFYSLEYNQSTIAILIDIFTGFQQTDSKYTIIYYHLQKYEEEFIDQIGIYKRLAKVVTFPNDSFDFNRLLNLSVLKISQISEYLINMTIRASQRCNTDFILYNNFLLHKSKLLTNFTCLNQNMILNSEYLNSIKDQYTYNWNATLRKKQVEKTFLTEKYNEYEIIKQKTENTLQQTTFNSITHSIIDELNSNISSILNVANDLKSKKNLAKSLPMNILLARVKLQESRNLLEKRRTSIIDKIK